MPKHGKDGSKHLNCGFERLNCGSERPTGNGGSLRLTGKDGSERLIVITERWGHHTTKPTLLKYGGIVCPKQDYWKRGALYA